LSAGAPPQTPLGELTQLPQTHWLDFRDLLIREGRGKEGRKEEWRGGERRGEDPLLSR